VPPGRTIASTQTDYPVFQALTGLLQIIGSKLRGCIAAERLIAVTIVRKGLALTVKALASFIYD
jgi:hypothetical protein